MYVVMTRVKLRPGTDAQFKSTMSRFAEFFTAPPEVSVNRALVDMAP